MQLDYKITKNLSEKIIDFTVVFETDYIKDSTCRTIQKEAESLLASRAIDSHARREISIFTANRKVVALFKYLNTHGTMLESSKDIYYPEKTEGDYLREAEIDKYNIGVGEDIKNFTSSAKSDFDKVLQQLKQIIEVFNEEH